MIPAAVIATLPLRRLRLIGVYLAFSVIAFGLTFLLKRAVTTFVGLVVLALIAWTGVANLPEVTQFLPHDAALSALGIGQSAATTLPPPTAALILAVWSLAAVGAAAAVLLRCDTK